jgi:GNAT superfamily N-acetyltransferase
MTHDSRSPLDPVFAPLTPDRWGDLEALFAGNGACDGCWCMWWRQTQREFSTKQGDENRAALKGIVDSGEVPGILAYDGNRPVGWVSVAPRERFGRLERSPVLKRVDERPVWSVVCFFINKAARKRGLTDALLSSAVEYAAANGASIVEGYPVAPSEKRRPDPDVYTGTTSVFLRAGFTEVARRGPRRVVMRRSVLP